jgi:uncharacterized protein YqeY
MRCPRDKPGIKNHATRRPERGPKKGPKGEGSPSGLDLASHGEGRGEGLPEEEILGMLQTMIRQRRDSIKLYEQGGRLELAEQEQEEIEIIQEYLPRQLGEDEIAIAVGSVIEEVGASALKDMGKVMSALRERYSGQMDFGRASKIAKQRLA